MSKEPFRKEMGWESWTEELFVMLIEEELIPLGSLDVLVVDWEIQDLDWRRRKTGHDPGPDHRTVQASGEKNCTAAEIIVEEVAQEEVLATEATEIEILDALTSVEISEDEMVVEDAIEMTLAEVMAAEIEIQDMIDTTTTEIETLLVEARKMITEIITVKEVMIQVMEDMRSVISLEEQVQEEETFVAADQMMVTEAVTTMDLIKTMQESALVMTINGKSHHHLAEELTIENWLDQNTAAISVYTSQLFAFVITKISRGKTMKRSLSLLLLLGISQCLATVEQVRIDLTGTTSEMVKRKCLQFEEILKNDNSWWLGLQWTIQ
jgi:hypothetical protein